MLTTVPTSRPACRAPGVGALAVLVLAGLTVACGEPSAPPGRVRLLELGAAAGAKIAAPAPAASLPPGVEALESEEGAAPARVAVLMGRGRQGEERRMALAAPPGTIYRFPVELPEGASLRFALGYAPPAAEGGGRLDFSVAVRTAAGAEATVFAEALETRHDGLWQEREVSLEEWAGERVTLELATRGKDAWGAWGTPEVRGEERRPRGWDVLLVSLDTLRADRLGCYGYRRPTSPRLDSLAARGVRFATAVSVAPWTRPAHLGLLTGLYPLSHGSLRSPMLADVLWNAGYTTAAFTGGGQVHPDLGFGPGFESFRVADWVRRPQEVIDWVEANRNQRRFLFLHTYEIHDPYTHAELAQGLEPGRIGDYFGRWRWERMRKRQPLSAAEKAYASALYDGGIAFTDARLGELLDRLEASGFLDSAIVLVTSDHGEQFWEHGGWRHGQVLYDHQLLVPLILYLPPGLRRELGGDDRLVGRVVDQQVSLVDVYPTLLDLIGLSGPIVQGRSLRPLLEGGRLPETTAFAENTNIKSFERKALRTRRFKYVHSYPKGTFRQTLGERVELYALDVDPGETTDRSAALPEVTRRFEAELRRVAAGAEAPAAEVPEAIDPELRKRLEALGYVGDDG